MYLVKRFRPLHDAMLLNDGVPLEVMVFTSLDDAKLTANEAAASNRGAVYVVVDVAAEEIVHRAEHGPWA